MADTPVINVGGVDYNVKDAFARKNIDALGNQLIDNTSGLYATVSNERIIAETVNHGYYPFTGFDSAASGGLRILNHPYESIVGGNIKKLYIKAYRETDADVYIVNIISGVATVKSKFPIHIDPTKTEYNNWQDFFSPYCFEAYDFIGVNVPTAANCLYFKASTGQGSYSVGIVDYDIGDTFSVEDSYNSYSISIGALVEKPYSTEELLNTIKYEKNGMSVSASTLTEGSIYTQSYSVKTDYRYVARFEAAALGQVKIQHLNADGSWTYLSITPTRWSVKNGSDAEVELATFNSPLTPQYMYVSIHIGKNHKASINIGYPNDNYVFDNIAWVGDGLGGATFSCVSGTVTNVILTVLFEQLNRPVWMFGDSYFHIDGGTTWMYHYLQDYDSVLISGYGGATTERMYRSWDTLHSTGCLPEEIIICTGMNDGSDSGDTPSANWLTWINYFIASCKKFGVEPVLATIPTVPTINHEAKNAWVRNSGYRYIDFAKAVGAQSNGTWYQNTLSGDGVHPTNRGATLLYYQALMDAPEIACP